MADAYAVLDDAGAAVDEQWKMAPNWHENRFGSTARLITRHEQAQGARYHTKHVTRMYSGARATNSLESAMPEATKILVEDVHIDVSTYDATGTSNTKTDIRRNGASVGYTIPAGYEMSGDKHSVWNIATELSRQAARSILEKKDQMLQYGAAGAKATVLARYNSTGSTTWSSGAAFITLTGVVSMFHKGELIEIRSGSTTTERCRARVLDVIYRDTHFGNAVGPGLVIEHVSWTAGQADTTLTNVTTGDQITASEEGGLTAPGYPGSFSVLCDYTASPGAYFSVTRTTAGNDHWIPLGRTYSASTPLDISEHFGHMFIQMSRFVDPARESLRQQKVKMTNAMICQSQSDLLLETCKQAGNDTSRFTLQIANTIPDAERRKLISVQGWDGSVIRLPDFPPLAMIREPLMDAGKIRIWDPNQWVWVHLGPARPQWLRDGAGMWHLSHYSSGDAGDTRLSPKYIASCMMFDTVFCECPRTVYEMQGPLVDSIS